MQPVQVFLLGPPRVERDSQVVPVNRRKMLALLAYLLVTRQPHSRETLATLFWPDFDTSGALANLRRDLSRLKDSLGGRFLHIERETIQIDTEAGLWVDTAEFERLIREADAHGHTHPGAPFCPDCRERLEAAANLYTDRFMAGFTLPDSPAFDDWQFFQSERLRGLLAGVLNRLASGCIELGAFEEAIQPARRWLALDPLHEPAQRRVMQLYAWAGQTSAALRQYQLLVDLLNKELGVAPEPETTALYEAIRARRISPPIPVTGSAAKTESPPNALFSAILQPGKPAVGPPVDPTRRYILQTMLSTGGFGEIYIGRDQLTGKDVAIKRLRPQLIQRQPEVVQRFLREGQVLSQLSHPNIVPMLDFYELDGQYNLVMEYLPGGTLRDLLEKGKTPQALRSEPAAAEPAATMPPPPLPLDRSLEISLELADALSRAHHLHILHRDLKPENILLDASGHPRLIDFGLAMLEAQDTRLTQDGMLIGSPIYMSPEALRGQELDARSDIWSFGVLLYEMLAGSPPFEADQLHALMQQITSEPLPPLKERCSDIPPALEQLIAQMLEKDREQRLPSMRQAAAALEAIRSGAVGTNPVVNHTPGSNTPPSSPRLLELPAQSTPLIGRENELTELRNLLINPACRLVTLVGPGGIGKTRLAIEAAIHSAELFANGVVFVPLAPLSDTEYILSAIASAMSIRYTPGVDQKNQLLRKLSTLNLLLIMDNFEHLIAGGDLLSDMLAAAPNLSLFVTSRERLNLMEEWVYEVSGLPYPPPGAAVPGGARMDDGDSWLNHYSAVQLFVERARRANPALKLDEETLGDVIRICQLVEGMPLALELAAPWVRAMTCKEIAQELVQGLDLLTTSMRNLPDRQRSIRVIFDQSWQSLSAAEQAVLSKLSVFHNGCTREAAEQVTGARPIQLMALVDKALLRHRGSRYEMHELVRQYAAERLAEDTQPDGKPALEVTLDRHHRYYLGQVAGVTPWLKGGRQLEATQTISADIDNMRAAWQRAARRGDREALAQAAEAAWLYVEFNGYLVEGEAAFSLAADLIQPGQADQTLAGFLRAALGSVLARQWHFDAGRALMEQGLDLLKAAEPPDAEKIGFALGWYAFLNVMQGRFEDAAKSAQESLEYFPLTGDRWTQAGSLRLSGAAQLYLGKIQQAEAHLEQCVAICKSIGELRIRTYATSNLGVIHLWYGQMEESGRYFDESLRISKSCNDRLARADALCERGRLFIATGEYERAIETARTCINLFHELGRTKISLANIILGKALRLAHTDDKAAALDSAAAALNEGLAAARSVNHRPDIATGLEALGAVAADRQDYELALNYFNESLAIWTEIGNEPEKSMLLCRIAFIRLRMRVPDDDATRAVLAQALTLAQKHGVGTIAITSMVGLEALNVRAGQMDRARLMLEYARQHPSTPHEVRGWVDLLLSRLPAAPAQLEDKASTAIPWQMLAKQYL